MAIKGLDEKYIGFSAKREWEGMPEFVQEENGPFHEIRVKFRNQEDMLAFAKMLDQTITPNTQGIWYPKLQKGLISGKRWVDTTDPKWSEGDVSEE